MTRFSSNRNRAEIRHKISPQSIPRLPDDLHIEMLQDGRYFIHNLSSRRPLFISQDVMKVVQTIDGKKSLAAVCAAVSEKMRFKLDVAFSLSLFAQLADAGVIALDATSLKKSPPSYLRLRYTLFSRKTLALLFAPLKMTIHYSFFFTSLTVMAGFVLLFTYLMIPSFQSVLTHFSGLSAALLFLYAAVSLLLHEAGHALALHAAGGKAGDIGFGFYLFAPVLYTDTSAAWHLPLKSRLVVNLAGIYAELILASMAVLVYSLSGAPLVPILAGFTAVKIALELFPFLRRDGYWILADLLDEPNLQRDSLRTLSALFKKSGFRAAANRRRRSIRLIYGSLQLLVTPVFLVTVLVAHHQVLIPSAQGWSHLLTIPGAPGTGSIAALFHRIILPLSFYALSLRYIWNLIRMRRNRTSW